MNQTNERDRIMRVERLGLVPYRPMLQLQRQRHAEVAAGSAPDTLFLLQHEPVITLGRHRGADNLLVSRAQLAARGIALCQSERGGDITYHGPGQLVGYPILALDPAERDVKGYIWLLEEMMIRTADDLGVLCHRHPEARGVWCAQGKLGAVGVRVANWVTLHGFAFNLAPRLADYQLIIPCGLSAEPMTSCEKVLGAAPPWEKAEERLLHHAATLLGRTPMEVTASPLPPTEEVKPI